MILKIDDEVAIVIDNGSGTIKAGYAGKENPQDIFPSVVGCLRSDITNIGKAKDIYIGDETRENICVLNLQYPIEHGIIQN